MKRRLEEDALGKVYVDAGCLWMSQTQRSKENFPIGTEKMPESLIAAFALLKKACAMANLRLGKINSLQETALCAVCDEILDGKLKDQFPLSVWQTGSGTQTNMNLNEVITVRGSQLFPDAALNPNDVANASQSSNDTFPSALHMMAVLDVQKRLVPVLEAAITLLKEKESLYHDVLKIGRTHLQDAAPLRFSQEISGWRAMLETDLRLIQAVLPAMEELAIGATAVGTGLNCPAGFDRLVCSFLEDLTGIHFVPAPNKFQALTSRDASVALSGVLKALAADMMKIANDVRWLASGPRCGLGEIRIPENEPGSSIMPGKVNPTQCEQVTMVAVQVMGNDCAVGMAASQGNFQLNVFLPLIAYNLNQSIGLLSDSLDSFCKRCLSGLEPDVAQMDRYLHESLMLVTCLNPVIGYKNAAKAARYAYEKGTSLKDAVLSLELLDEAAFDELVRPEKMVGA